MYVHAGAAKKPRQNLLLERKTESAVGRGDLLIRSLFRHHFSWQVRRGEQKYHTFSSTCFNAVITHAKLKYFFKKTKRSPATLIKPFSPCVTDSQSSFPPIGALAKRKINTCSSLETKIKAKLSQIPLCTRDNQRRLAAKIARCFWL